MGEPVGTRPQVIDGVGLHGGRPVRVVLRASGGPVVLRAGGCEAEARALSVVSAQWGTTVEAAGGAFRVATVEHALAALAGLGVYTGVAVEIDGPEMPLLDGAAATWCAALDALRLRACPPRLRVARAASVVLGASCYDFKPGDGVAVRVCFETDDVRLAPDARWDGDPDDFRARIAPARTFVLARDLATIERLGLARHVDPRAVVAITKDAIHCAGRPFEPDEPARHKLLDLVGDLYLHGGPPRGMVVARRPGHAATWQAICRARDEGILAEC
ncbi:MAG: UDP-3-O-acyl-N-acetylglucosamine deacetylase [Polyangiaceae bacterium]|nr:UDP-3-O-acyl-N-acetylglucosamine deacetylase [Polyangiaceae bacterium]